MAIAYGTRINDTNFITEVDLDNNTCETTGYINGEAVDFSGGGSSDFSTAEVTLNLTPPAGVSIIDYAIACEFYYPSESHCYRISAFPVDENNKCNIILYQGFGYIVGVQANDAEYTYYDLDVETALFSGGVIFDEESGIVVTGNGSITGSLVLGN